MLDKIKCKVYNLIIQLKGSDFMGRPPAIPYDKIPKMKFERLKPIKRIEGNGRTKWLCECDCGNTTIVTQKNLCNRNTKSCGCIVKEGNSNRKHGESNTRLYELWTGIKRRCYGKNNTSYKWYGAKGIKMCKEWLNDYKKFRDWAYSTGYDESLPRGKQTIERKDTNGNYCPENCEWKTIQQQQRNKSSNRPYEYNGEIHLLPEWAEILGLDYDLLRSRVVNHGWTLEQAITEPINSKVKMDKIKIEYKGEKLTIKEWSQKLGISEHLIRSRMFHSKDPEFILKVGKHKKPRERLIEYNGKTKNIKEWAKELGMNYGTIKRRIYKGYPIEKVLSKEDYSNKAKSKKAEI